MPFGVKPICFKCGKNVAEIWHKTIEGYATCNECFLGKMTAQIKTEPSPKITENKTPSPDPKFQEEDGFNDTVEMEEVVNDEPVEDVKPRNESGPGTRSSNAASSSRGGRAGVRKTRGRSKKIGNTNKAAVGKGRGRRAIFKKQVNF